jgi:hypothetical protein
MPKTPPQTSLQGLTGGGWHSSFFGGVGDGDGEAFSDSELSAASMNGNDPAS